jgi:hypothetical protein
MGIPIFFQERPEGIGIYSRSFAFIPFGIKIFFCQTLSFFAAPPAFLLSKHGELLSYNFPTLTSPYFPFLHQPPLLLRPSSRAARSLGLGWEEVAGYRLQVDRLVVSLLGFSHGGSVGNSESGMLKQGPKGRKEISPGQSPGTIK